jgi:hypothetical protein
MEFQSYLHHKVSSIKSDLMKTLPFVLFILLFVACKGKIANFEASSDTIAVDAMTFSEMSLSPRPEAQFSIADHQLIRTGSLDIAFEDVAKARVEIENICKLHRGYISSETQNNSDHSLQYNQVIRIPSGNFDSLIHKIETLNGTVVSKSIQTDDVTEEFIDKEARIKTKKELELRYYDILKKATKVTDMLSIEAQLNDVRSDIESMQGRVNFLKTQVAFSTLTLSLHQPIVTQTGFTSKIISSVKTGWDVLLAIVIGIVSIWPIAIVGGVFLYYFISRRRKYAQVTNNE